MPRLGWEDTLAYLTIPVILVCTQTLSLQLLGSFDAIDDGKEVALPLTLTLTLTPNPSPLLTHLVPAAEGDSLAVAAVPTTVRSRRLCCATCR